MYAAIDVASSSMTMAQHHNNIDFEPISKKAIECDKKQK